MKVKIFSAMSIGGLEKKVNEFISKDGIKVLELQHAAGYGSASVMVVYEEKLRPAWEE